MPASTSSAAIVPSSAIVIVTFNSASTIDACLDAVARSTPQPHELIVVDNASTDGTAERVRARGAKLISNTSNRGFSAACNQGIAATGGAHVVLLNPDTEVKPGWLGRILACFDESVAAVGPLSDFVAGEQKASRFAGKPLGAPKETKLLIGFCLALRRDLLEKHGALDESLFLGNDDLEYCHRMRRLGYRLLIATDAFVHHEGQKSFASLPKAEIDRLVQESTDALQRKLEAEYGEGKVPTSQELWGIDWFKPRMTGLVSIVIPAWNNLKLTRTCVGAIARFTTHPHEVIVVDNGSTDGTPEWLATQPHVRAIRSETNLGFAGGTNLGLRAARGRHVVLLNNDVVVTSGWLEGLLEHVRQNPKIGIVGPRTNFASGPQQVAHVSYRTLDDLDAFARAFAAEHRGERMVHARVTGLCMLVTGRCREAVGLLDERFGIGNFEDDDYCLRARLAGFECAIAGDVYVHHFGSQTFKEMKVDYRTLLLENKRKFVEKWQPVGLT